MRRRGSRERTKENFAAESISMFAPADDPDGTIFREQLSAALAVLPEEQRMVVHLKLWEMFVSYAPELDIGACGESVEQAKRNLMEVVQINFDEMRKLDTLDRFLQEAGFDISTEQEAVVGLDKELIGFATREIAL